MLTSEWTITDLLCEPAEDGSICPDCMALAQQAINNAEKQGTPGSANKRFILEPNGSHRLAHAARVQRIS